MALVQVGFLATYLSGPLISGFMCASAFHVLSSQFTLLFGIHLPKVYGPGNFFIVRHDCAYLLAFLTVFYHGLYLSFLEILQPLCSYQRDQCCNGYHLHSLHCGSSNLPVVYQPLLPQEIQVPCAC